MKNKLLALCLIGTLSVAGCSSGNEGGMTKLDKKFDSYAREAAITQAEQEATDRTWTTVELGQPEYNYTFYNESSNKYKVSYLIKFDEADKAEDHWLMVDVILTGDKKLVSNVEVCYADANSYEAEQKYTPNGTSLSDGIWYNINLTEKEKEEFLNRID